jgi:hypothetical protein
MRVPHDLVRAVFEGSIQVFLEREAQQLLADVNERASCSRLAIYMQRAADDAGLAKYAVDTEYNRMQEGRVKTILDDEHRVIAVNCDLILHSRGEVKENDNLIAVEMKKSTRPAHEKKSDRDRLRALTMKSYDGVWSADGVTLPERVCDYTLGVYIEVNRTARTCLLEFYGQGNKVEETTRAF